MALKEQELKRLRQKMTSADDQHKVTAEATASAEARLATAHAERDNAKRAQAKVQAELAQKSKEVAQLEKHVALLVGDTGVAPQDLERALNLLREADAPDKIDGGEAPSLRLQDTDLDTLGLTPLAKRQVMGRPRCSLAIGPRSAPLHAVTPRSSCSLATATPQCAVPARYSPLHPVAFGCR